MNIILITYLFLSFILLNASVMKNPWQSDLIECNDFFSQLDPFGMKIAATEGFCHPLDSIKTTSNKGSLLYSLMSPIINYKTHTNNENKNINNFLQQPLIDPANPHKFYCRDLSLYYQAELQNVKNVNQPGALRRFLRGTAKVFGTIVQAGEGVLTPVAASGSSTTITNSDSTESTTTTSNTGGNLQLKSAGATAALGSILDAIDTATLNIGSNCNDRKSEFLLSILTYLNKFKSTSIGKRDCTFFIKSLVRKIKKIYITDNLTTKIRKCCYNKKGSTKISNALYCESLVKSNSKLDIKQLDLVSKQFYEAVDEVKVKSA